MDGGGGSRLSVILLNRTPCQVHVLRVSANLFRNICSLSRLIQPLELGYGYLTQPHPTCPRLRIRKCGVGSASLAGTVSAFCRNCAGMVYALSMVVAAGNTAVAVFPANTCWGSLRGGPLSPGAVGTEPKHVYGSPLSEVVKIGIQNKI